MSQGRLRDLWAAENRALLVGLLLTITLAASESLAVLTVMPLVARTGLAAAGLAESMPVLVAGRALQGLGAGVVPAVAYAAIGVSLPEELRPRMIAVISAAWIAPGLAGPVVSATIARAFGWRWVFLGLLPVAAIAGSIAVPALVRIGRPGATGTSAEPEHSLADAISTAIGVGLLLAGLTVGFSTRTIALALALAAAGLALAGPAVRRLVPAGTLTARRGLPAAVLSRGLLTFTFFGADSFVTLSITVVRHYSALVAGLAVTGATVAWTGGAWTQARLSDTWEARRLVRTGLIVILAGIAGMTLMLEPGVPVAEGIAAWTIAGLGMGLANSPIMLLVLRAAPEGRVGQASASVNLADVLGTATGIGVGGAAIAATASSDLQLGIRIAFAIAATVALLALLTTLRLPRGRTSAATTAEVDSG